MKSISAQDLMMEIIKGKSEEEFKSQFSDWVQRQRFSTEIVLPFIQTHDHEGNCWITILYRHHANS